MPDQVSTPLPPPPPAPAPTPPPAAPLASARERAAVRDEVDHDLQLLRAIFDGPLFS